LLDTPDNLLFSWHIIHPIHARIGFLLSAAEALLRPDIRNSNASHWKKILDSLSRLLKQTKPQGQYNLLQLHSAAFGEGFYVPGN
jgi:hypothetical protein